MAWKPRLLRGGREDDRPAADDGPSDAELARLIASGTDLERDGLPGVPGRDAFALLVRRHEVAVRRLALRLLRDSEDARDVAQDAFLRAYRSMGSFDPSRSFRSWIFKICVNAARDHRSRWIRGGEVPPDGLAEPVGDSDPAGDAERRILVERVRILLDELSPREREVFVLRDLEGLEVEEVAGALDLAAPTVRRHLARARLRLRRLLDGPTEEKSTDD